MTKYLTSLATIGGNQEQVPVANLEAKFDLNDAWKKLDKEDLNPGYIVVDPGWQALEETGFDDYGSNFWRDLVIEQLRNDNLKSYKEVPLQRVDLGLLLLLLLLLLL